jgi:hypothetical protein
MKLEQIDTSTTAGKAEVMRLAAEGRAVAYYDRNYDEFRPVRGMPSWDWSGASYAIIAEPVGPDEVFAIAASNGVLVAFSGDQAGFGKLAEAEGATLVRYVRADQ